MTLPQVLTTRTSEPPQQSDSGMGLWALIRSDIRRKQQNYVLVNRFFNRYIKIGFQHGTLAVVVYRIGHWAHSLGLAPVRWLGLLLYRLLALPINFVSRVQIDPRTPIGSGFVIHNFSSVFIQAERIGENFTINQGVSVGPDYTRSGLPRIGSGVYLGSGATVLGKVELGDNVVVAANCSVLRSIGSDVVVAGVPGIAVMRNTQQDYVGSVPAHVR